MCQVSEHSDYRAMAKAVTLSQLYTSGFSAFDGQQAKVRPTENILPSKKNTKVSPSLDFFKISFYFISWCQ